MAALWSVEDTDGKKENEKCAEDGQKGEMRRKLCLLTDRLG